MTPVGAPAGPRPVVDGRLLPRRKPGVGRAPPIGSLWVDIEAGAVHEGSPRGDRLHNTGSWHGRPDRGCGRAGASGPSCWWPARSALVDRRARRQRGGRPAHPAGRSRPPAQRRRCDPAGTSSSAPSRSICAMTGRSLVRVEPDRSITTLDDDLTCPTGSRGVRRRALYSVDTVHRTVFVRDYPAAGSAAGVASGLDGGAGRHLRRRRRELGSPFFGAGAGPAVRADRRTDGHRRRRRPELDSPRSSATRPLLITTATAGMTPAQLGASIPNAGRLFVAASTSPVFPIPGVVRVLSVRAFVITGPASAEVQDVADPVPRPGRSWSTVERAGVCGTDVEFFTGEMAYLKTGEASYPIRIGHEWAGTVERGRRRGGRDVAGPAGHRRHDARLPALRTLPRRPPAPVRRPSGDRHPRRLAGSARRETARAGVRPPTAALHCGRDARVHWSNPAPTRCGRFGRPASTRASGCWSSDRARSGCSSR